MSCREDQSKQDVSTSTPTDGYLLRRNVRSEGVHLRAGTPVRKGPDGWYHGLDDMKLNPISDSDVCSSAYRGVTLCVIQCDDEGFLFAGRVGTQEALEPIDPSLIGLELKQGDSCVCVVYGGRYFALEFFGW